jgi:hypothetical protein
MIIDSQSVFSLAQAITSTAISAIVLDMRNAATPALVDEGFQGGDGCSLWIEVLVTQAFNTLTSLTIVAYQRRRTRASRSSARTRRYWRSGVGVALYNLGIGNPARFRLRQSATTRSAKICDARLPRITPTSPAGGKPIGVRARPTSIIRCSHSASHNTPSERRLGRSCSGVARSAS